ncbi:MAG: hypothetical protein HW416_2119 [Chloroflexi bacterium]|nr:hypothetical protein [Chloroflexota bacterium]
MPEPWGLLFRWLHFIFGITWIGMLYYLNLVNVRMMPSLDAADRPKVIGANLRRVMAWFRHTAWLTVLVGLVLIVMLYPPDRMGPTNANAYYTIYTGSLLGLIMAFNVWVFIWPRQKKIIAAAAAGEPADPAWGRIALYFSRANFTMSFPMLFFMGTANRGGLDWLGIIVTGVVLSALGLVAVFTVQKWWAPKF